MARLALNDENNEQDANDNVVWPKYTYDPYYKMDIERDQDKPDPKIFFELGHDPREKQGGDPATAAAAEAEEEQMKHQDEETGGGRKAKGPAVRRRHYRKYYTKELEQEAEVMGEAPFLHERVFRTKPAGAGLFGLGASANPKDVKPLQTGVFKGLVQVYNDARKQKRVENIEREYAALQRNIREAYKLQVGEEF